MKAQFNRLKPAEHERLVLLMEECAEVIHISSKILRHGYDSFHPNWPGLENRFILEREMGDVRAAMLLLCSASDVSKRVIHAGAHSKTNRVRKYLHHQSEALLKRWSDATKE